MRTSGNAQSEVLNGHSVSTTADTRNVSKVKVCLTPSQAEFMDWVCFYGVKEFSKSLKLVHDLALYHSDVPFDATEKHALFDVKQLWEGFERMGEEA